MSEENREYIIGESHMTVDKSSLSFEEAFDKLIGLTEQKDDDIIVMNIAQLEFIGKIWKNTDYSAAWKEAHSSGFMETLYKLQGHKRDFTLFIKDELMIGIEKPHTNYNPKDFDHITVPASSWVIAFAKDGSAKDDIVELWNMVDEYMPTSEYLIDDEIPIIEKYPGGPHPIDLHLLLKPVKQNEAHHAPQT